MSGVQHTPKRISEETVFLSKVLPPSYLDGIRRTTCCPNVEHGGRLLLWAFGFGHVEARPEVRSQRISLGERLRRQPWRLWLACARLLRSSRRLPTGRSALHCARLVWRVLLPCGWRGSSLPQLTCSLSALRRVLPVRWPLCSSCGAPPYLAC